MEEKTFQYVVDGGMNIVHKIMVGNAYTLVIFCEHTEVRDNPFYNVEYIEVVPSSTMNFDTISAKVDVTDDMSFPIRWYEDGKLISNSDSITVTSTHMNNFPVILPDPFWLAFRQLMDYVPQKKVIKCIRGTQQGEKERHFEIRTYPHVKKELAFSTSDEKLKKQLPGFYAFKTRLEKFLQQISGRDKVGIGFDVSFVLSGQWAEYSNQNAFYKVEGAFSPSVSVELEFPYGLTIPKCLPINAKACFFIKFFIQVSGKISISRRAPSSEKKSLEYVGGIESGIGLVLGFEASVTVLSMSIKGVGSASTFIAVPIELIGNADEICIQSKIGCSGLVLSVSFVVEGYIWDSSYTESWQVFDAMSTEPLEFILGD